MIDKKFAQEKLEYWKKQLLMNNYKIDLQFNCNKDDFELDEVFGEASYNYVDRIGVIRIGAPELYDGDELKSTLSSFDFEETLVHELLHIKFNYIQDIEDGSYNKMHTIIQDLTKALIAENRRELVQISNIITDKSKSAT